MRNLIVLTLCFGVAQICEAQQTKVSAPSFQSAAKFLTTNSEDFNFNGDAAQILARERASVARNSAALAALRAALRATDSAALAASNESNENSDVPFPTYGSAREFARLLVRESNVKLADGDALGAMNSRLDALRLASIIARDARLMDSLVARAMESVALGNLEKIGAKLSAAQCLDSYAQIETIKAQQPTFVSIVEREKKSSMQAFEKLFASSDWKDFVDDSQKESWFTKNDRMQLKQLSRDQIVNNISIVYDAAISKAKLPYASAQKVQIAPAKDAYSRFVTTSVGSNLSRFSFERGETKINLVQAALLQRARRLGATNIPILPRDPFGIGPLQFKNGAIYSVGPDGIDDGGKAFRDVSYYFDATSGQRVRRINIRNVQLESRGDILAPKF